MAEKQNLPLSGIVRFREEYYFLSNFYPATLHYQGITYGSSEAAYQAQKCADAAQRVQFASLSADESKTLGSTVAMRVDWDAVKLRVMEEVVYAKFTQNPDLAQRLLQTGDTPLYEGNTWHDIFWGVDLESGEGDNHLGKILMALRRYFADNGIPAPDSAPKTDDNN